MSVNPIIPQTQRQGDSFPCLVRQRLPGVVVGSKAEGDNALVDGQQPLDGPRIAVPHPSNSWRWRPRLKTEHVPGSVRADDGSDFEYGLLDEELGVAWRERRTGRVACARSRHGALVLPG